VTCFWYESRTVFRSKPSEFSTDSVPDQEVYIDISYSTLDLVDGFYGRSGKELIHLVAYNDFFIAVYSTDFIIYKRPDVFSIADNSGTSKKVRLTGRLVKLSYLNREDIDKYIENKEQNGSKITVYEYALFTKRLNLFWEFLFIIVILTGPVLYLKSLLRRKEYGDIPMGNFLALSSVIGKTKDEVIASLANYAKSVGGGLEREGIVGSDIINYWNSCIIEEANGNTSILYPDSFTEWDDSSKFISKELNATVFSFHIHDGDLWMYILFHNGLIVDQFNPIPDYWDDNLSQEEIDSWKGNAQTIVKFIPSIKSSDIDRYLVRWDLDDE
jgi:hypothetical protein